jgi:pimeloyl-ACP methyl ester carboxylesterase
VTTFGLIAGGCHNAWCWDKLIPELSQRGYRAVAPTLPTDDPKAGLDEYASAVAAGLANVDGPIILVGHSMAGYYLPLAAARVGAARMVFLGAIVPKEGLAGWEVAADNAYSNAAGGRSEVDDEGRLVVPPDLAQEILFADADPETADWAKSHLQAQGSGPMTEPFPVGGWPAGVPCSYILMTDDRITEPRWARQIAQSVGTTAIELPGSHSPFLSRPALLADTLVALV